jgi:hypothetical protein
VRDQRFAEWFRAALGALVADEPPFEEEPEALAERLPRRRRWSRRRAARAR